MPAMMSDHVPLVFPSIRRVAAALALALFAGAASNPAAADPAAPVVVELYTSQGCNSCPPADAYLAELAERPELIALSFHVDYWNYIGWSDPFSSASATQRQRDYGRTLGSRVVYTPQMVVDGQWDVIGSQRDAVERAIAEAAARPHLPVTLAGDATSGYRVILPATRLDAPARLWMILYDREHETTVTRGENAGTVIENRNVVRSIMDLGAWDGTARELPLTLTPAQTRERDGCAVIVQKDGPGSVLGAAAIALAK
jgi:hypothetical protein